MFQPAVKVRKRLKIVVYGDAGTGKTWFALQAKGRKAVIDTENGTDFYAGKFEFDVVKTRLYSEVKQAIDYIENNPDKYDVLVIDPITNIYQTLKDAAQLNAENRARRKRMNVEDATLTFRDWGIVKNKFNSLISRLCNLPCHVVITGWLKEIYEGVGDNLKKVGSRPDADRKLEYQPDVIIRLEVDGSGNRWGIIEKDRTMTYQTGQRVKDISFNDFLGAVNEEGVESKLQIEEDVAKAEAEISESVLETIKLLWSRLGYKPELVNSQTNKIYGCALHELTNAQGLDFIQKLKTKQKSSKTSNEAKSEPSKGKNDSKQRKRFFAICRELNLQENNQKALVYFYTGKHSRKDVTESEYKAINDELEKMKPKDLELTLELAHNKRLDVMEKEQAG